MAQLIHEENICLSASVGKVVLHYPDPHSDSSRIYMCHVFVGSCLCTAYYCMWGQDNTIVMNIIGRPEEVVLLSW